MKKLYLFTLCVVVLLHANASQATPPIGELSLVSDKSHQLSMTLWKRGAAEPFSNSNIASGATKTDDIFAEVDARMQQAKNGDRKALIQAINVRTLPNWFSTDLRTQDKVRQYINEQVPQLLTNYFSANRVPVAKDFSSPRKALIASKDWYEQNEELFIAFNTQQAVKQALKRLYIERDAAYKKLLEALQSDIASANNIAELNQVAADIYLKADRRHSSVWPHIAKTKNHRLQAIEQEAYVARVGEGLLRAGDDGALYINALSRGDLKIIAEEDKKFAASMVKMTEPLLNSGVIELMSFFSGSQSNPEALKNEMRERIKSISMSSAMTGLFIVAYEHLAPKCLGPKPVAFERTVVWEEVSRNILGQEFYRNTFSKTYHYTIARRHADLFKQLGQGTSAGSLDAMGSIYGALGMIPQDVQKSIFTLSDNLRGVTHVMKRYECDSMQMRTLEKALVDITRSRL